MAVAVGVIAVGGAAGLALAGHASPAPRVAVRTAAAPVTVTEPSMTESTTTTTSTTAMPVVTTSVPPVKAAAKQTTTTVAVKATTSTTASGRTFTVSPMQGGASQKAEATGTGCAGPSYGVSVTEYDSAGQFQDGSGSASQPDGSWMVPMYYPPPGRAPGRYKMVATCSDGVSHRNVFVYAPVYVNFTG